MKKKKNPKKQDMENHQRQKGATGIEGAAEKWGGEEKKTPGL